MDDFSTSCNFCVFPTIIHAVQYEWRIGRTGAIEEVHWRLEYNCTDSILFLLSIYAGSIFLYSWHLDYSYRKRYRKIMGHPRKKTRNLTLLVVMAAYGCEASIGPKELSSMASCERSHFPSDSNHIPRHFEIDDMTEDECLNLDHQNHGVTIVGSGRELNLFDFVSPRGGDAFEKRYNWNSPTPSSSAAATKFQRQSSNRRKNGRSGGRSSSKSSSSIRSNTAFTTTNPSRRPSSSNLFQSIRDWVAAGNLPSIQCRVEPNTTLKVRKTFRPLKTIIRLGADFNTQLGVWQFRSSWEDALIGGKLTLAGRELQFTKTWLLSVGTFNYLKQLLFPNIQIV